MLLNALVEKLKRRAKDDFKGRHFEATLILQAASWYLRYPLSYRDIEELFLERGLEVDHSTLNRWVLAYAPLIERRLRTFRKPHCGSIRVDETYIKIRGQWRYLYRAIDKHGNPVDFLLTAKRDLEAAKRFFRKALKDQPLLSLDRIGTDGAGPYPPAIAEARKAGLLARTPLHYVTKHLQQGIESDHFRVKRPMPRIGCFQAFHTARRTIQGFEAMLWLRKGRWCKIATLGLGNAAVGRIGPLPRFPDARCPTRPMNRAATRSPGGALRGPQLARVRQGTAAARQSYGLGDAAGARGLAPAPEDWSEGPATRLFGRGDRDRAPAAPGLWSALAANRGPAALTHDPARGERRCAGPHHVFPAQPWPGARCGADASPGERAGSRRDRRDRPEGLWRGRVAGGEARGGRAAGLGRGSPG